MEKIEELKQATEALTVLYVEDDLVTRTMNKKKLAGLFKEVMVAEDGQKGLDLFNQKHPDLIITDNIMPNMDGIDMIREIRQTDTKIPIVITTAYIDIEYLMQAINLNVTQFVSKPVEMDALINAIDISVQRVVLDNISRKAEQQEIELLRYKEKYHSSQQENALKKELNIIENNYFFKRIFAENKQGEAQEWLYNVTYEPLEILSGDSYSVRDMGDGKVVFFIIDGMGKGLSASVTTTLSVAFFNHLLDRVKDGELELNLSDLIMRYVKFIDKELLDEEIVSNTYCLIDFKEETLEASIYSLPPILFQSKGGEIRNIKSNNMPITKYTFMAKTEVVSIADVDKIMIYSDGLNESFTKDGNIYGEYLDEDFKQTWFMKEMMEKFRSQVEKNDDDLTMFHLVRMPSSYQNEKRFCEINRLKSVEKISIEVEQYITEELQLGDDFATPYMTTFTELIMNAYEHGNLGITTSQKTRLIKSGEYDDYLLEKEKENDFKITVIIRTIQLDGRPVLATYVEDEGKGFDTHILEGLLVDNIELYLENGRGIIMSQGFSGELLYNQEANGVLFLNRMDIHEGEHPQT